MTHVFDHNVQTQTYLTEHGFCSSDEYDDALHKVADGATTSVYFSPLRVHNNKVNQTVCNAQLDKLSHQHVGVLLMVHMLDFLSQALQPVGFDDDQVTLVTEHSRFPDVHHDRNRVLHLFSFGLDNHPVCPTNVEHTACLTSFHGERLPKELLFGHDGREQHVQDSFVNGKKFSQLMTDLVTVVESKDLHSLGACCNKGRHRSPAVVELLKKHYYPNAVVTHFELNE
jgi:hypothetical protein